MIYIHENDIPRDERHLVPFDLPRIERLRRWRRERRKARRKRKAESQPNPATVERRNDE